MDRVKRRGYEAQEVIYTESVLYIYIKISL